MPAPAEPARHAIASAPVDAGAVELPAGFWRRAAAWCADMAMLSPLLVLAGRGPARGLMHATTAWFGAVQTWMLQRVAGDGATLMSAGSAQDILAYARSLAGDLVADPTFAAQSSAFAAQADDSSLQLFLRIGCVAALWFIGFEASPWQATPGKRLAGLRVVDMASARLGPARAAARFFAGALSWLTFNIGHALAGWRHDHRALHDLVAGTQVLGRGPTPRWVRAAVAVIVVGAVLLPFALVARVLQVAAGG